MVFSQQNMLDGPRTMSVLSGLTEGPLLFFKIDSFNFITFPYLFLFMKTLDKTVENF